MKVEITEFPNFDHIVTRVEFKKRIYWILSFYQKLHRDMLEVIKLEFAKVVK